MDFHYSDYLPFWLWTVSRTNIIFVVQINICSSNLVQNCLHHEGSCRCFPTCLYKLFFQLKFNLRNKLQNVLLLQTNQNFFWCSQCIIWLKSLGKWYWHFNWKIIFSLDMTHMSCHMAKYLFFQLLGLWTFWTAAIIFYCGEQSTPAASRPTGAAQHICQ